MQIVVSLVLGYYLLEVIRHFFKQKALWNKEDSALPIHYKASLWLVIALTCIFWPLMYLRTKVC